MSGENSCWPSIALLARPLPETGPVSWVQVTSGGSWLALSNHWMKPLLVSLCTQMAAFWTWLTGNEKET